MRFRGPTGRAPDGDIPWKSRASSSSPARTRRRIIVNGVDYHNIAATAHAAYRPVGFYLKSAREKALVGLLGEIRGG